MFIDAIPPYSSYPYGARDPKSRLQQFERHVLQGLPLGLHHFQFRFRDDLRLGTGSIFRVLRTLLKMTAHWRLCAVACIRAQSVHLRHRK